MYKFNHHMPSYEIPLKQEIPCLEYDIACYCKLLLSNFPCKLPKYLESYGKCLRYHAKRQKSLKPSSFPDNFRVYIIDYRLNVLFAAFDPDGKIATCFSQYPLRSKMPEDYYYGDGEFIGGCLIPGEPYDPSMRDFSLKYGFLPIEELAMACTLVFVDDHIDDHRPLSQFQTQVLMHRYRTKNLVDWKAITKSVSYDFKWLK